MVGVNDEASDAGTGSIGGSINGGSVATEGSVVGRSVLNSVGIPDGSVDIGSAGIPAVCVGITLDSTPLSVLIPDGSAVGIIDGSVELAEGPSGGVTDGLSGGVTVALRSRKVKRARFDHSLKL